MMSVRGSLLVLTAVLAFILAGACRGGAADPIPPLLFGLGPEATDAASTALNAEAPLGMYTNWYSGPSDLEWMSTWQTSVVPQIYASGRAIHLIIYSGEDKGGTPCGRQYPISPGISDDMVRLAHIFAGTPTDPPLYVTLFTEFQTYPCVENQWVGAEDYYTLLQAKMVQIRDIFHLVAPNARVSIGWGGWQDRWDDPASGGGRSLFAHFAGIMRQMDFQSIQAMQDDTNVDDVRNMTRTLGAYGPVMVAHYKPDSGSLTTDEADMRAIMTDSFLREVAGYGLFAWSFMGSAQLSDPTIFALVKDAVLRYGRPPQPRPESGRTPTPQ